MRISTEKAEIAFLEFVKAEEEPIDDWDATTTDILSQISVFDPSTSCCTVEFKKKC